MTKYSYNKSNEAVFATRNSSLCPLAIGRGRGKGRRRQVFVPYKICVKFIMKLITDYVYTSGAHIELHQTNKKNVLSYSTVSFVVCI